VDFIHYHVYVGKVLVLLLIVFCSMCGVSEKDLRNVKSVLMVRMMSVIIVEICHVYVGSMYTIVSYVGR
jgi:hypothetical protein